MPWSMAKNSLVSWPALVPQLENNVVATDSPLLRWHADTHVSMSAGFWPRDRWSTSFHLGGLVTPRLAYRLATLAWSGTHQGWRGGRLVLSLWGRVRLPLPQGWVCVSIT